MAAHQDHCGTFVIDPFDIDADCCMHVKEPLRPHQSAVADLTLTNNEQSKVEGEINWKLADAETGEVIAELPDRRMPFALESGETKDYHLEVVPEDTNVIHTQINDYDDMFLGSIWYALENVRAPDEVREHGGGEPDVPPQN